MTPSHLGPEGISATSQSLSPAWGAEAGVALHNTTICTLPVLLPLATGPHTGSLHNFMAPFASHFFVLFLLKPKKQGEGLLQL